MADPGLAPAVVVSGSWERAHDEAGFVMRTVASALSRLGPVEVAVPGAPVARCPDGAFDPVRVGGVGPREGRPCWPEPGAAGWPLPGPFALTVVEDGDPGSLALADEHLPGVPTVVVGAGLSARPGGHAGAPTLDVGPATDAVGCHVPVHQLAASRGHVGIDFDDYVLVLGDPHGADATNPTPAAAWLAARFPRRHVLVVRDAETTVWRARSLRGFVTVDSRTDLWRLISHARLLVDLAPGPLIARECVESLLYGVPIVVPAGTTAAHLAAAGGGLWFSDEAELLGCVEAMDDEGVRDTLGDQGQRAAVLRYGDGDAFVARVRRALSHLWI